MQLKEQDTAADREKSRFQNQVTNKNISAKHANYLDAPQHRSKTDVALLCLGTKCLHSSLPQTRNTYLSPSTFAVMGSTYVNVNIDVNNINNNFDSISFMVMFSAALNILDMWVYYLD